MSRHPYGDGRLGVWAIWAEGFAPKLRHRLPALRRLGVTDVFLPREAGQSERALVRDGGCFVGLYETPPHGLSASSYAARAIEDVSRLRIGVLELNIEGLPDGALADYVERVVQAVRAKLPHLRLRINVVPFKGAYLPADRFASDRQLFCV
ncbi:MAG: hypothetical protein RMM28_11120, partial [Thermoleophilia bacterium]|nr:hypothetical protein [Thermoleophilia bacterium]